MKTINITALKAGAAPFAVALALISAPAFAQAAPQADAVSATEISEPEAIVVTGSRIARRELNTSVPVAVLSPEKLTAQGATNVLDTLQTLPAVGQGISRSSSNFSNTGNGVATVNLRNLGTSRTLVLINGRRTVGTPGNSSADLNNIPTELVDRVEVVTGGASAVYGSEAISGVVNFVLKNKFEGVSVHGQGTISDKGDAARQYISVLAGHNFADGAGNITVLGSFDKDYGLPSRNRSFSANDFPNRSSFAAQGLFSVADPNTQTAFNAANGLTYTFGPDGKVKGYQGANTDGYNRNQQRYLSLPVERYTASALGHYDFGAVTAYAEGTYVKTKSNASLEALAVGNTGPGAATNFDESPYAGIPITSPYVPAEIRAAAIANGVDVLQFRRRSVDIFSRSNRNDRDFWRAVGGVKGEIAPKWNFDIYYEHSQTRDFTTAGSIYSPNYGAALSNEVVGGKIVCSDPAARAAGCVPINIFGLNTVSPAAAKFLQTYTGPTVTRDVIDPETGAVTSTVGVTNGQSTAFTYLAKNYQDVLSGQVSGELFSLWGRPAAIAAGGEYRKERSSEVFDPFTQLGLSSSNQITNTIGSFNVKEVFAELVVPIVEDRPLLKYLGIEAAGRYADYSTTGGIWSYKGGVTYAPSSDIRFRAVWARATRAPNIGELFSAKSQTFPAVNDPCDQAKGGGDGAPLSALPQGCAAIPGIAATVAQNGSFAYGTAQLQTIDGLTGGNLNLKPEQSDTITAGVVITPSMIRNLSLTVDYYHIKVKDAIGIIGQQISVAQCFQTANPLFCDNVKRDAKGFVTRVNALNLNTGSYLVEGLDAELHYRHPAGFLGSGGMVGTDILYNHRFAQEQTPYPGGDVQNELGQADCYSCGRLGSGFKDRGDATFWLESDKFRFSYNLNYLGPLTDNTDGSTDRTHISPYTYQSAQLKFYVMPEKKFEFYVGMNNIFNITPPIVADGNPASWPGTLTVATTYDLYGRMLYAGFTARF